MAALKAQFSLEDKTIEPKVTQLDTSWEVRIRQRGYKAVNITASSLRTRRSSSTMIESDRAQGLVVNYTKAHHVTFAELKCPGSSSPVNGVVHSITRPNP
jgi:hypothetical protein